MARIQGKTSGGVGQQIGNVADALKVHLASGSASAVVSTYLESARHAFSTPITSSAWTTLITSTVTAATKIALFSGAGFSLELGIGAAASETRLILVPPGGFNGMIELTIAAGSRVSIKAVGAAIIGAADDPGELVLNLFG